MLRTSLYDRVVARGREQQQQQVLQGRGDDRAGAKGSRALKGRKQLQQQLQQQEQQHQQQQQQQQHFLVGVDSSGDRRDEDARNPTPGESGGGGRDAAHKYEYVVDVDWDRLPVVEGPPRLCAPAACVLPAAEVLAARPLTPSNPLLLSILSPSPPRGTAATLTPSDWSLRAPTPPLRNTLLAREMSDLDAQLSTIAAPRAARKPAAPVPPPAVDKECHFARNRRALLEQVRMIKEHTNVPLLHHQKREAHRQGVAERRELAVTARLDAKQPRPRGKGGKPVPLDPDACALSVAEVLSTTKRLERIKEAKQQALARWHAMVVMHLYATRIHTAYRRRVAQSLWKRCDRAARTLQMKMLPRYRKHREAQLKTWFSELMNVAKCAVRWRRRAMDRKVERIKHFLRTSVADKALAISTYMTTIRKTKRMAANVCRIRRERRRALEHWYKLVEGWVIINNIETYAALLPEESQMGAIRHMRLFVKAGRRHAARLPMHLACSVGSTPPLIYFRSQQPPEPLVMKTTPFQRLRRVWRASRRWAQVREFVYRMYSRRRRTRERRIQQLQASKIDPRAAPPPGPETDARKRSTIHRPRSAKNIPNLLAVSVEGLRRRIPSRPEHRHLDQPPAPAEYFVNKADTWDALPHYLRPLRLPAYLRDDIIVTVLRATRLNSQQSYMKSLVSYRLSQRLRHIDCLGREDLPRMKSPKLYTVENEWEMIRRIRVALDERVLEAQVARAGRGRRASRRGSQLLSDSGLEDAATTSQD